MAILPKAPYKFNAMSSKLQRQSLLKFEKVLKFIETWNILNSQRKPSKKNHPWKYHTSWLHTILQNLFTKIAIYWYKRILTNVPRQVHRASLIWFLTHVLKTYIRKMPLVRHCCENGISAWTEMELNSSFTLYKKKIIINGSNSFM